MGDVTLDTSDVDRWVGVPLGGGYLKDPVHVNDIRRWAQGMQNPNPLYYVPHPRFGEAVVLCAVRSLDPVSAEDITDHLRGVLASYKVPRRVLFFDDEELTYTGSQKVRLEHLRSLAARRVAEGDDDWGRFLRQQHAELIAAPVEDV